MLHPKVIHNKDYIAKKISIKQKRCCISIEPTSLIVSCDSVSFLKLVPHELSWSGFSSKVPILLMLIPSHQSVDFSKLVLAGVEVLGFEIGENPRLRIRASARFGHYKGISKIIETREIFYFY